MDGLDFILGDIKPEEFFKAYYEQKVLHVTGGKEKLNNVLSVQELSAYLDRADIFYPAVRLVKNGKELPKKAYIINQVPIGQEKVNGVIDTGRMMHCFNNGATIVVQGGQHYFQGITKLGKQLSSAFGCPVQANLYITPDRSVGFNPHWDTHDVFVLQVHGTKTWHLYDFQIKLPTKSQPYKGQEITVEKTSTLQLAAGDMLYVPRGFVHDAIANDGVSAHITIGILAFTWERLFREAFEKLYTAEPFRKAVHIDAPDFESRLQEKFEALKTYLPELNYVAARSALKAVQEKRQPPGYKNYFGSLLKKNAIDDNSEIALNKGLFIHLQKSANSITIAYAGKKIIFPKKAETAIDFILQHEAFIVSELPPPLNAPSKIVLVKKLVEEGLLYGKQI
jgi:ribosomal protein L16 Arg81 hydroxylase